jgi:hypothetical protein
MGMYGGGGVNVNVCGAREGACECVWGKGGGGLCIYLEAEGAHIIIGTIPSIYTDLKFLSSLEFLFGLSAFYSKILI